jgi:hypothetical protein
MQSHGIATRIQSKRLRGKKTARNGNSNFCNLVSEADYKFNETVPKRVAVRPVDRKGMLGGVKHSNRRGVAMNACFASANDLTDELRIAPERRERRAKSLRIFCQMCL